MTLFDAIRKWVKARFDAIENIHIKRNLLNALPFWLGSIITGIVAVFYAQMFLWAEHRAMDVYHYCKWWFFLLSPLMFVASWYLIHRYAPYARGSGIPQVSAAIELSKPRYAHLVNKLLSVRVLLVKVFSSIVMVLGGGVIGREGPTIQISASIFKVINDILPDWYPKISKRNMIVTGAAAGLAAAFNTPLGGIVFAIEELTKTHFSYFKSALLVGVIISGLTALNLLGPYLYLGYPFLSNISGLITFAVIPVAIVSGIIGAGMGQMILYVFAKKRKLKGVKQNVIFVAACGIVVAALAVLIDEQTLGSGKEIMQQSLFTQDKHVAWYLPILRFIGPVISFSTGSAGGIFAPSLSAGASVGSLLSSVFHLSDSETNLLILCGMVACLTGITRSPFTSSILVNEMTNSHNVIFYLMLTGLLANVVATLISKHSFYDHLKDQYIHEIEQEEGHSLRPLH